MRFPLLDRLLAIPNDLGWRLSRFLDGVCKIDCYRSENGSIVRSMGRFREEAIPIAEIESWSSLPEMTFDIVCIRLKSGEVVQWLDKNNDLLRILSTEAAAKLSSSENPGRRLQA